jgi:hypothetical protein
MAGGYGPSEREGTDDDRIRKLPLHHGRTGETGRPAGGTGALRITNAGPARILVRNDKNDLTLGAGSRLETDHAGETLIALDPSDPSGHASGTSECRRVRRT